MGRFRLRIPDMLSSLRASIITYSRKSLIVVTFSFIGICISVGYMLWNSGFYNHDEDVFDNEVPYLNYYITVEDRITDIDQYYRLENRMKTSGSSLYAHQTYKFNSQSITYILSFITSEIDSIPINHKIKLDFTLPEHATIEAIELIQTPSYDDDFFKSILKPEYKNKYLANGAIEDYMLDNNKLDSINNLLYKDLKKEQQFEHEKKAYNMHDMSFIIDKSMMSLKFTIQFNKSIGYLNTRTLNISGYADAIGLPVEFSTDIQFSNTTKIENLAPTSNYNASFFNSKTISLSNLSQDDTGHHYSDILIAYSVLKHKAIHDLLMILLPMLLGACISALIQVYLNPKG